MKCFKVETVFGVILCVAGLVGGARDEGGWGGKCVENDLILSFVESFIEKEFPWTLINIVYNGKKVGFCERVEETFLTHSLTLKSSLTVIKNVGEGGGVEWRARNESYMEGNFHFHQLSLWTELNVVFVNTLEKLDWVIRSNVFKREDTFNVFLTHELAPEIDVGSVLMLPGLAGLKYKVGVGFDEERKEMRMQSVCFYCDDGDAEVVEVYRGKMRTLWREEGSLPGKEEIFRDYTRDFYGKTLRVSLSKGIPTMMNFKILKSGRIVTNGGFQTSLFHLVRRKLNFSYKIRLEPVFGLEGANGTFTGMVGAVETGKSDLGIGAAVTYDRHKVVHYLTPNTFHIVTFITRSSIFLPDWETIFLAFTAPLWFSLFLVTSFIMLPLYVVVSVFGRGGSGDEKSRGSHLMNILARGAGFIFRPLVEQHRTVSRNDSIRILSVFWLFSVLVIGAEFKSNLIKLFLSPPMEELPTTFTQLANSDYDIYTHYAGGSLEEIVRSTHTKTFDRIREKMKLEESIRDCLNVTLKKKAACISYEDDAMMEGQKYFSDPYGHLFIHRAPIAAFNFFASIILPKEAVYIDAMEEAVSQIVDMGITKRFHDEQFQSTRRKGMSLARKHRQRLPTYYDSHHHYARLSLGHFSAAFSFLAVGTFVAVCVWLVEQREGEHLKRFFKRLDEVLGRLPLPTLVFLLCPSQKSKVSPLVDERGLQRADDDEADELDGGPTELLSD